MSRILGMLSMVLVVGLTSPLLALAQQDSDRLRGLVLVIAAPFGAPIADVITQSGLQQVYPDTAPFGGFVLIDGPDDLSRLRAAGAIFVLPGERILALC